jgi:hypothetical protein
MDLDGPWRIHLPSSSCCHRMASGGSRASPAARGCLGRRSQAWWWWPPFPPKLVGPWRWSSRRLIWVMWQPVKTEPRLHSWRTMMACFDVVTLVKALSLLFSSLDSGCSGGNPRSGASGLLDDGGTRLVTTLEGIIFFTNVSWRCCFSEGNPISGSLGIDDGDERRRSSLVGHHFGAVTG